MASRKISEKTLELNLCAELLQCIRSWPGSEKALWVGLTQAEESRQGIDERLRDPRGRSLMLQFKSPKPSSRENGLYKFNINLGQHRAMETLAKGHPDAVFYVFPLYTKWPKADQHAPDLAQDTWLLPISCLPTSPSTPSSGHRQVDVTRIGSRVLVIARSLGMKTICAVNADTFCQDFLAARGGGDFISSEGIPAEELRGWLAGLRDTGGDPQDVVLRFRRLNALFLPG